MEVFVLYVILNTGALFNVGILETEEQCLEASEYIMENAENIITDRIVIDSGCYVVNVDENGVVIE